MSNALRSSKIACFAAAAAATAACSFATSSAQGALMMDVYASFYNGAPITPTKSVTVAAVGDTVTFQIRAVVTGSDPTKFQIFGRGTGSLLSTGGTLRGDLLSTTHEIHSPYTDLSSSAGLSQDLDGDGDLDLGSNVDASPQNFMAYAAENRLGPRATYGFGPSVWDSGFEAFPTSPGTMHTYFVTRYVDFVVTAIGTDTFVNYRPRIAPTAASWIENADEVITPGKTGDRITYTPGIPGTGGFTAGQPVQVSVVPEPGAAAAAAGAIALLLSRRRRSTFRRTTLL